MINCAVVLLKQKYQLEKYMGKNILTWYDQKAYVPVVSFGLWKRNTDNNILKASAS
jgi:hypothetical protein